MSDGERKPRLLTLLAEISAVFAVILSLAAIVIAYLAYQNDLKTSRPAVTQAVATSTVQPTPPAADHNTTQPQQGPPKISESSGWREALPWWAAALIIIGYLLAVSVASAITIEGVIAAFWYLAFSSGFVWLLWPLMSWWISIPLALCLLATICIQAYF